jgi:hypothetical protein
MQPCLPGGDGQQLPMKELLRKNMNTVSGSQWLSEHSRKPEDAVAYPVGQRLRQAAPYPVSACLKVHPSKTQMDGCDFT